MKKNNVYAKNQNSLRLPILLLAFITVISSCSKSSDSTTTLVGDWKKSSEFEGVARTEAVTFTIGTTVYVGGGFDGTNRLMIFGSSSIYRHLVKKSRFSRYGKKQCSCFCSSRQRICRNRL
ncbi:MAG: hypothetical protein WDM90_19725 [Ferruginibacter sp.]